MRQKPNRLLVTQRKRAARKGEAFIVSYEFPSQLERRTLRKHRQLDEASWPLVERGLREWFVCCAWRGRTVLGMPSRLVDDAWHEFILDTLAYTAFCNVAFGAYLHHTPDEAMSTAMGEALANTVRAWDRSEAGRDEESVLWDLDEKLDAVEPLGVDGLQLSAVRSATSVSGAAGMYGGPWLGCAGGGGGEGGGCGGGHGGCGGGGSCGGGGCGGGGCGGGS